MTWLDLYRAGKLPDAATVQMVHAADRQMAGRRLTPGQADLANRLLGVIEHERANRNAVDWDLRDELLRQDGHATAAPFRGMRRPSPASAAAPARPGAVTPSAPRSPASGLSAGGVGGALPAGRRSSFDARAVSADDYHQRLSQLNLDSSWHQVTNATEMAREMARSPSLSLRLKQDRMRREAQERNEKRTAELAAAGALDARVAAPEQVRQRMAALGVVDPDLQAAVREKPQPLPPKEEFNPMAATLEAQRRAQRRAREAAKSGRPANAREMSPDVFREFLKLKGYASPSSWGPAGRAPSRR